MSEIEWAEARLQTNEFLVLEQTSMDNFVCALSNYKTRNVSLMFVGNSVNDVTKWIHFPFGNELIYSSPPDEIVFFSLHRFSVIMSGCNLTWWRTLLSYSQFTPSNWPSRCHHTYDNGWMMMMYTAIYSATCQALIGCTMAIVSHSIVHFTPRYILFAFIEPLILLLSNRSGLFLGGSVGGNGM